MSAESTGEFLGTACVWFVCAGLPILLLLGGLLNIRRKKKLVEKYGDDVAKKILDKEVWQGMTSEMLLDSRGKPKSIDQTVMKTKTKETWKYDPMGKGQYATRIFLENEVVIGWELNRR